MPAKQLSYSGVLYDDRRRFYPNPQMVALLYPSVTPFISSLFARGGERVPDKDYKMFEHRAAWRYQQLQVNEATPDGWSPDGTPGGTVTVGIDELEGLTEDSALIGHEVEIWDNAQDTKKGVALITAYDAGTSEITLKALGNPSAASFTVDALADNDVLFAIGTAFGEGDDAPEAQSDELDVVYNSVQREKTALEITEDLRRAVLRGRRNELARLRNQKQMEHKIKLERSFLFGMRPGGIGGVAHGAGGGVDDSFTSEHITDAESRTVTTTMGIFPAIERYGRDDDADDQQNYFERDGSSFDYAQFVEDMEKIFQYDGRGVKTAYVGAKVLSFFSTTFVTNNQWDITISGTQTNRLGFNYRILETPHGILRLVKMNIFRRTPYDSQLLYVDEDMLQLKQYAPDEYVTNIKTDNDPDLQKDQFKSWSGLGLTLMERHGVMKFANL